MNKQELHVINSLTGKPLEFVAAITAILPEIIQAVNEGAWVSVDERLPEIEQEVLLLYRKNVIQGGRYNIRADSGEYTDEWEWWCELLDMWGMYQNCVTHWMPLPQQPKGVA